MLKDCAARFCAQRAEVAAVFCPFHLDSLPADVVEGIRQAVARLPFPDYLLTREYRDAVTKGVALIMAAEEGVDPAAIRAIARARAEGRGPLKLHSPMPGPPASSPPAPAPAAPPAPEPAAGPVLAQKEGEPAQASSSPAAGPVYSKRHRR